MTSFLLDLPHSQGNVVLPHTFILIWQSRQQWSNTAAACKAYMSKAIKWTNMYSRPSIYITITRPSSHNIDSFYPVYYMLHDINHQFWFAIMLYSHMSMVVVRKPLLCPNGMPKLKQWYWVGSISWYQCEESVLYKWVAFLNVSFFWMANVDIMNERRPISQIVSG